MQGIRDQTLPSHARNYFSVKQALFFEPQIAEQLPENRECFL